MALMPVLMGLAPAHAQQASSLPATNTIILELDFEDWAEPKTALVSARVGIITQQTQSGLIQARIKAVAEDASNHAAWRMAKLTPAGGARGAALWQAMVETRMTPDELGRLERTLSQYENGDSRGTFTIERIDFAPTLAEIQAVRAALRAQAYQQAAREIRQLNLAFPDKTYRIASITFAHGIDYQNIPLSQILGDATALPRGHSGMRREGEASHVTMTARVTLIATPRPAGSSASAAGNTGAGATDQAATMGDQGAARDRVAAGQRSP
ncbi:MAG: hypothetical protein AAF213_07435 [Pseudomonadota bacterium]